MSEEDSGGGLVDPGGILSVGPDSESNYFVVQVRPETPCTCKPRRFALMTMHQDGAFCPRCQIGEPPRERAAAAFLGDLAALLRDIPDAAGKVIGLVLILAALLGYLAVTGWIPR